MTVYGLRPYVPYSHCFFDIDDLNTFLWICDASIGQVALEPVYLFKFYISSFYFFSSFPMSFIVLPPESFFSPSALPSSVFYFVLLRSPTLNSPAPSILLPTFLLSSFFFCLRFLLLCSSLCFTSPFPPAPHVPPLVPPPPSPP